MLEKSQISSYSSKKNKEILGLEVEGYDFETNHILNTTRENIFENYSLSGIQNTVFRSTFFRYIPSNFINPKKKTDMCPICHAHSGLIAHCNGFKKIDQEVPQNLLDQLNAANQHKATVFNQKMAFDLEKESLNTSKC